MSRLHGKDVSVLSLAAQSLLADTISIGPKISAASHDTTTLGDDWMEATGGLKGGDEFDHELFYDNAATTGTWAYLTGKFDAQAAVSLIIGDGVRTVTGNVLVTGLSLPIAVGDMMKVTASYKFTGAVTFS